MTEYKSSTSSVHGDMPDDRQLLQQDDEHSSLLELGREEPACRKMHKLPPTKQTFRISTQHSLTIRYGSTGAVVFSSAVRILLRGRLALMGSLCG